MRSAIHNFNLSYIKLTNQQEDRALFFDKNPCCITSTDYSYMSFSIVYKRSLEIQNYKYGQIQL